jgi:hypothetical protein
MVMVGVGVGHPLNGQIAFPGKFDHGVYGARINGNGMAVTMDKIAKIV